MSFEKAYEEFLKFAIKRQKKQSFDTYKYNFESKILPYFRTKRLEELTSQDILAWQNIIVKLAYSNNYNRNLFYMLSAFFSYCCTHYGLDKSIITNVGCFKRKYEERKTDFYTVKEFKKFIKFVEHPVYKQFFNLMFFTGTRPGEAMALKFSDLRGDILFISKTIHNHGKRELDTPKNSSSVREIKIDRILKRDLLRLRKNYEKKYNNINFDFFIFGGLKPLAPTTINRYKFKACKKANLRAITLHQFRHSHATLLLQNGIVINEISRRLGHSKVSTTLNVYTHTNFLQEKRVQSTLNRIRFKFF